MKIRRRYLVLLMISVCIVPVLAGCQLLDFLYLYPLVTAKEKKAPEEKYYNRNFAPLPADVEAALSGGPVDSSKALKFEDINDLLNPGYLEVENGYCINPDGTGFVAVRTDIPGATADMIQWWFWWHANKNIRYKIWCPGDHYAISVKNEDQARDLSLTYEQRRVNNVHYPWEDTGTGPAELSIRFVSPETFDFDTSRFSEAGVEAVVCGVVGYVVAGVTVEHTRMTHVFRRNGSGLELRTRFWPGSVLAIEELRSLAITEDVLKGLGRHCGREYNHLAEFLPEIYQELKDTF